MNSIRIRGYASKITQASRPELLPLYAVIAQHPGQALDSVKSAADCIFRTYSQLLSSSRSLPMILMFMASLLFYLDSPVKKIDELRNDDQPSYENEDATARGLAGLEKEEMVQRNMDRYSVTESTKELVRTIAENCPNSPYHEVLMTAIMHKKHPEPFEKDEIINMVVALDGFPDLRNHFEKLRKSIYIV